MTEFVFPQSRRKLIGAFAVLPALPLNIGPSNAQPDSRGGAGPDDAIRSFRIAVPEAALWTFGSVSWRPAGPTPSLSRTSRRA